MISYCQVVGMPVEPTQTQIPLSLLRSLANGSTVAVAGLRLCVHRWRFFTMYGFPAEWLATVSRTELQLPIHGKQILLLHPEG